MGLGKLYGLTYTVVLNPIESQVQNALDRRVEGIDYVISRTGWTYWLEKS